MFLILPVIGSHMGCTSGLIGKQSNRETVVGSNPTVPDRCRGERKNTSPGPTHRVWRHLGTTVTRSTDRCFSHRSFPYQRVTTVGVLTAAISARVPSSSCPSSVQSGNTRIHGEALVVVVSSVTAMVRRPSPKGFGNTLR